MADVDRDNLNGLLVLLAFHRHVHTLGRGVALFK